MLELVSTKLKKILKLPYATTYRIYNLGIDCRTVISTTAQFATGLIPCFCWYNTLQHTVTFSVCSELLVASVKTILGNGLSVRVNFPGVISRTA